MRSHRARQLAGVGAQATIAEPTTNSGDTDMSKSNVNPNHYKVAGRERQGEDIAQTRNKQKHAESVVRRRTELGARSRKPAAQDGAASPDAAPTLAAKAATRKARATPVRALRPTGAAPQLPKKKATKKASIKVQERPASRRKRSMSGLAGRSRS
jgi:hypothetical protein